MPVRSCLTRDGQPAWRWGKSGTPYSYGHGTGRTSDMAVGLAVRQGRRRAARAYQIHEALRRSDAAPAPVRRLRSATDRVEAALHDMLTSRVRVVERAFLAAAREAIEVFQGELDARRKDSAALDVQAVIRAVKATLPGAASKDAEGLHYLGEEIDDRVTEQQDAEISRLYHIPLATSAAAERQVADWVRVNVDLIKSLQGTALDEIEQMVSAAMTAGKPTLHLLDDIQARFGVSYSKASLLARDQTAKLAGRITEDRQTRYGITQYIWSTSGDARVRQAHADLDGSLQEWASPPTIPGTDRRAHPGGDFQCRCAARPVPPDSDVIAMLAEATKERELWELQSSPTVRGGIYNYSGFSDWNSKRIGELRSGMRSAVGL